MDVGQFEFKQKAKGAFFVTSWTEVLFCDRILKMIFIYMFIRPIL